MGYNLYNGNYGDAAWDAGGLVVDIAATAIPYVPGGAASALKASRAANRVIDATNSVDTITDVARQVENASDIAQTASELRNLPGVATGGQELANITGRWLRGSTGVAGKLPGQIAEQLSGQTFKNFDEFRGAFWKTVANDPNLANQFDARNIARMTEGKAPYAPLSQQVGGQQTYQLHHIQPINQGGGVYDLDNIVIVSPRYHQEVLDPKYHYGR